MRFALILWAVAAAYGADAPNPTGIAVAHSNGQTFITWIDPLSGSEGQNLRYRIYRSTSGPITDPAAATLVMDGLSVFNNSGQFNTGVISTSTRTTASQAMVKIPGAESALPAWSGLAVYTAEANDSAYYAVVAYDRTGSTYSTPSPILSGQNATISPVSESVASIAPVLQRAAGSSAWTGASGLPMYLCLHQSSQTAAWPFGGSDTVGDVYALWGDSTMAYQQGVQQMFAVMQNTSLLRACAPQTAGTAVASSLQLQPRNGKYKPAGTSEMEDSYYGYLATPFGGGPTRSRPYTEAYLDWMVGWVGSNYLADTNRIYCAGRSMGGWACGRYAFRRPNTFAAVFPDLPRWDAYVYEEFMGAPNYQAYTYNIDTDAIGTANLSSPLMPDGTTPFITYIDAVAAAQAIGGGTLPWIGWGIGRQDQYAGKTRWFTHVNMVNALKAAKLGFAFCWNNADHSSTAYSTIQSQYTVKAPDLFARNRSYPALHNFSLDANPGNGDVANGDLSGCINAGFSWTSISETANSWTAAIANSTVSASATVDVTPRNTQSFVLTPGRRVTWTASTGQSGTAIADAQGLVTAAGVTIQAGLPTTVTFLARRALFPLPHPVRR